MNNVIKNKYNKVFYDCWEFFKKYGDPNGDDKFWDSLIKEMQEIYVNHDKDSFTKKMLNIVLEEIEKICNGE
jgi:hypothetical protein